VIIRALLSAVAMFGRTGSLSSKNSRARFIIDGSPISLAWMWRLRELETIGTNRRRIGVSPPGPAFAGILIDPHLSRVTLAFRTFPRDPPFNPPPSQLCRQRYIVYVISASVAKLARSRVAVLASKYTEESPRRIYLRKEKKESKEQRVIFPRYDERRLQSSRFYPPIDACSVRARSRGRTCGTRA